jgi:ankyrin repeat protein
MNNHHGCVKRLLIEPHIDVNVKDEKGRSLIILSLLVIDKDTHNFIEFQIKKGANVNITDFEGNSPLHYIAKYKP